MAVDKSKLIGKVDIIGVVQGIEHPTKIETNKEDGKSKQVEIKTVVNLIIENPTTKSTVSLPFFTNEWDKLQYFDNGQPQRVSEQNATEEMKRKAIKYEIKGQKETKTYLTVKSFVDALKLFKGKKVKIEGTSRYRVNTQGFLQQTLECKKVEYIDQKTTDYRLQTHSYVLLSKKEIEIMDLDKELELYVPLGTQNEYYKQKAIIPLEIFLDGALKTDKPLAKQILDTMRNDCAKSFELEGYYLVPATIELENGKAFREPTEDDVTQGVRLMHQATSKGDMELYKQKMALEFKKIGLIPVERGIVNISIIAFDKVDYVEFPSLQDHSTNSGANAIQNATQNSMQKAIETMKKLKENNAQASTQGNEAPKEESNTEVLEEKKTETGNIEVNEESKTEEINTETQGSEDKKDETTATTTTTTDENTENPEDQFPF
ncbi:hypothetical protein FNU3_77 [Fusobacterium phage vB_FnuS_FNU3]|uniref:Uncharacterized protein n=1 Tax=Fusobacterium phage Fnu1 TaxID=2530024 RepID=A0A481W5C8_9CAUD|nr:hypothetical protein KMD24_gp129 [Fusobacterium phage Fnu1]QBJ04067.1 hypothetical protein [Fusobacterium phage Fnu1]WGH50197.1 hypothetical protein FNU2_52 [Fusobacterium phage vB_FnuS_FNU2]WGH50345.1 hypothetical protein FNU3_77 [Fusobacterium phage vB_FnuS_FNU3]